MIDIYAELVAVLHHLDARGIEYAICGGLAVSIHGYPRFTKDIDLLVLPQDCVRIAASLKDAGWILVAGEIPFSVGTPAERSIFRISKMIDDDLLTLDLLLVSPALASVWESRCAGDLRGRRIVVVSRQGLATMKRLAGRPRDLIDLQELGLNSDDSTPKT